MNQCEAEADSYTCELAAAVLLVRCAQDNHQEYKRQQAFYEERATHGDVLVTCSDVSAAEEITVAVGCERADSHSGCLGDSKQHSGSRDATEDLCAPVGEHLLETHSSVHKYTQRNSGIEVCTGDMADGIRHGQNSQTKRERNAQKTNMAEDCGTATAKNQPECAQKLGTQFVT